MKICRIFSLSIVLMVLALLAAWPPIGALAAEAEDDAYNLEAPYDLMASFDAETASIELTWHCDSHTYMIFTLWRQEYGSSKWTQVETSHYTDYIDNAADLQPNMMYQYKVSNGTGSSDIASVYREALALNAPLDVKSQAVSASSIQISWTNANDFDTNARIFYTRTGYDDALEATVKPGTTSLLLEGLAAGTSYDIKVQAYTAYESSESSAAITVATGPENGSEEIPPEVPLETMVLKYQIDSATYLANGQSALMDAAPAVIENRIMLPIRYVVEPLGGSAEWDPVDKKATVNCNGHVLVLWLNSNSASLDGVNMQIDPGNPELMPLAMDNRIMMPLRFVGESLDCGVQWNPESSEAIVSYPDPVG